MVSKNEFLLKCMKDDKGKGGLVGWKGEGVGLYVPLFPSKFLLSSWFPSGNFGLLHEVFVKVPFSGRDIYCFLK